MRCPAAVQGSEPKRWYHFSGIGNIVATCVSTSPAIRSMNAIRRHDLEDPMPATHFLRFMMLGIFIAILAAPAGAQDFKIGLLAVSQPWLRATPSGTKVGGGYLTI